MSQDRRDIERELAWRKGLLDDDAGRRRSAPQNLFEEPAPRLAQPANLFHEDASAPAPRAAQPAHLFEQDSAAPRRAAQPANLFEEATAAPRPAQSLDATTIAPARRAATSRSGSQHQQAGTNPRRAGAPASQPPAGNAAGSRRTAQPQRAAAPAGTPARPAAQAAAAMPYTDDPTRIGQPALAAAGGNGGRGASGSGGGSGRNGGGGARGSKASGGGGGKKPPKKGVGKKVFFNICKAAFSLFCAGVVVVSIMAVVVAGYVVESTQDDDLVLDLDRMTSSQTGYILAWDENTGGWIEYQRITGTSNSIWTSLQDISPYVKEALIATEDRDFYNHGGVSISRTIYAGLNQVFHFRSTFGGSTIDQQLVKNITGDKDVFGEDGDMSAGYMRKLREIFRAVGLNNNYSKDIILEAYLNTMPLSGTIIGVGAGAKEYYNKTPAELTIAEAATIVGITNSPSKYNPYTNPDNCIGRRDDVLTFMYRDEVITEAEYRAALATPLGLYEGERVKDASTAVSSYFADTVYWQVTNDLVEKGIVKSREEASSYYLNGGLRIETTIDLRVQETLEEMALNAFTEDSPFPENIQTAKLDADGNPTDVMVHPEIGITIFDYEGRLLGIVGGTGEKEASLTLNRAYSAPRPVGSTMKMVAAYALGLEYGVINWSQMLEDTPSGTRDGKPAPLDADGVPQYNWPTNYGAKFSGNYLPIFTAVSQSLNTIAVRVGDIISVEEMFEFATETLGISTLDPVQDMGLSSMVLGGQYNGITAFELGAAYAMYGNGGNFYSPRSYERVLDAEGNVIMTADSYPIQAISEENAYIGNRLMRTVITNAGGTAYNMGPERMDAIAKTGTTSDDKDRWFVGMTPYYVTSIWMGYDDNYKMEKVGTISKNPNTIAWRQLMNELQADLEERSFPAQPAGVVQEQYCIESGYLAGPGCPGTGTGYYNTSMMPDPCPVHEA